MKSAAAGVMPAGRGGPCGVCAMLRITVHWLSASGQGCRPVSISMTVQPRDQTSARRPALARTVTVAVSHNCSHHCSHSHRRPGFAHARAHRAAEAAGAHRGRCPFPVVQQEASRGRPRAGEGGVDVVRADGTTARVGDDAGRQAPPPDGAPAHRSPSQSPPLAPSSKRCPSSCSACWSPRRAR